MIILVCGGRDYSDYAAMCACLDQIPDVEMVIQGGARGADALAKRWANDRGIHCAEVPAMWDTLGKGAGPSRNWAMLLLKPHAVVAFPGGAGTGHMKRSAASIGVPVWEAP